MSPGRFDAIRREIGLINGVESAILYRTPVCRGSEPKLHPGLVSIAARAGKLARHPLLAVTNGAN